jgi:hypothetical protein
MELSENGNLLNYWLTDCTHDMSIWKMKVDNCGNPIITGGFDRKCYFGEDTLTAESIYYEDGFIAKLQLQPEPQVDMGPDTASCGPYTIEIPDDFEYYIWNDEMTNQNWHLAQESGSYTLAAGTSGGCWAYDTIFVEIFPEIEVSLGEDITACDSYELSVDDNFNYYFWNDVLFTQPDFPVSETGEYTLAVTVDSVCWAYDTINVHIQPPYDISLGPDTTIKLSHSAVFAVPDTLDFVQWSNGEISASITFNAWEYGVGDHEISVITEHGVCSATDTIMVNVVDDTGLNELSTKTCKIHPNPFNESLIIESTARILSVKIVSVAQVEIAEIETDEDDPKTLILDTSQISKGLYLVIIKTETGVLVEKVVKP